MEKIETIRDVYTYIKEKLRRYQEYLKKEKDGCKEESYVLKKVKRKYQRRRKECIEGMELNVFKQEGIDIKVDVKKALAKKEGMYRRKGMKCI